MKLSQLFTRTLKEVPADETAKNAQLLIRGGFVYKNSAGIYSFLPLGWRVIEKIIKIIREEINTIGGQEIFMPALVEKKYMEPTKRWNLDIGFFAKGLNDKEADYLLGWTHEEVLTAIASKYVSSYKDLPFAAYQIQTKFRNEARPKSGLLRGREFMMKDLYSFHTDKSDLYKYYDKVKGAYLKIFERCHLNSIYTVAAGGVFTISNTHEFQVLSDIGEDTIYLCSQCSYAENKDISSLKEGNKCPQCGGSVFEEKSIEVGNIFPLGTKYSEVFNLKYVDKKGIQRPVEMGSYGIGISRLMATIVQVHADDKGLVWPESVAPHKFHLIALDNTKRESDDLYNRLIKSSNDVLYDDREDKAAGEKFADADLIGCPIRLVVSEKTLEKESLELKKRKEKDSKLIKLTNLANIL